MNNKQQEANKEIVKRLINDGFNKKDLSLWDKLVSPDCVLKHAPPGPSSTREAWKQNTIMLHTAFPDVHAKIEQIFADGDKVVVYETTTGTHQSDFAGMPATGKRASVPAFMMVQFKDGKIIAQWSLVDANGLMAQLGASA